MKVGFETDDEVADSTADETDDEASVAADFTSSTASARAIPAANAATAIEAKRIVKVACRSVTGAIRQLLNFEGQLKK